MSKIPLPVQNFIAETSLITCLKYAVSCFSDLQYIAPIAQGLADYQNNLIQHRIIDTLQMFHESIKALDENAVDKEYLHSETFIRELLLVMAIAQDEDNEQKRRRLADFLVTGCTKEHVNDEKKILLMFLNQIDEIDICILKSSTDTLDRGNLQKTALWNWNRENPDNEINEDSIEIHISFLDHIGLIEPVDLQTFKSFFARHGNITFDHIKSEKFDTSLLRKHGFYKRTIVCRRLLAYIKNQPEENR